MNQSLKLTLSLFAELAGSAADEEKTTNQLDYQSRKREVVSQLESVGGTRPPTVGNGLCKLLRQSWRLGPRGLGSGRDPHAALFADFVREIWPNPCRRYATKAHWLTDDVTRIASTMYEQKNFSDMPILADALEEAGCNDQNILDHCREDRAHVRGCWVVDLLLGKE
ncbi:MAG: hypothetical protein ACFCD0_20760 [Gemmataceae bacterium]